MSCLRVIRTDKFIEKIESQTRLHKEPVKGKKRSQILKFYDQRKDVILEKLDEGDFIECNDIDALIDRVVEDLMTTNPWIKPPNLILLDRDITFNAYSFGEGTIGVHIGTFRKLSTVSELAFLLAHEMAHYHLDHTNEMVRQIIRKKNSDPELYNQLKFGDVNAIHTLFYEHFSNSRVNELEADSVAFLMIANSPYDLFACKRVLEKIDSAEFSEYQIHPDIKSHLHFSKFPFKDEWVQGHKSVLSNNNGSSFIFDKDSTQTHPLTDERLEAYQEFLNDKEVSKTKVDVSSLSEIKYQLEFQLIDLIKEDKRYEYAFYYVLKFRDLYPANESFKYELLEILTDLYEVRKNHNFGLYVDHSAKVPWLEDYVNFLNNLTLTELGQLIYHYFQTNIRFDYQNEEHYLMLWKASKYAEKSAVIKNITDAYLEKFPQGIYANHFLKQKNQK